MLNNFPIYLNFEKKSVLKTFYVLFKYSNYIYIYIYIICTICFADRAEDILHKGTVLEKDDRYTYLGQLATKKLKKKNGWQNYVRESLKK